MSDLKDNIEASINFQDYLESHHVQLYKDYRLFLKELFELVLEKEPKYSYRRYSRDLGFTGSGYISFVLKKQRNLSSVGIKKIIAALGLNQIEASYFEQLVYYNQERVKAKKEKYKNAMSEIMKEHEKIIIDKPLNYFLSNRMCSVIALMVDQYQEEFQADPLWILRRVRIKTTPEEISGALHFLIKNGAIERVDGGYRNIKKVIGTTEDIKSGSIQEAHRKFLDESLNALNIGVSEREFGHITFLIDESKFDLLKNRIKEFKDEIRNLARSYDTIKEKDKLMIAMNVQLYPVTKKQSK